MELLIKREKKRLEDLLEAANVPQRQRETLQPVIDNIAWQRVKLDEAREQMQHESLTCEYDNGGGQSGTRENPIFKAYLNLWRGYMAGFEKFSACLPKEMQEEAAGDVLSVLEQVRQLKKAKV